MAMIGEIHIPALKKADLVEQLRRQIRSEEMDKQPPISDSPINPRDPLPPPLASFPLAVPSTIDLSGTKDLINAIKNLGEIAQSRTIRRQQWPDSLNRFPWILFKPLQVVFFGFLNLIFKDQREVNHNLIASLNQLILLNESLLDQVNTLRSQSHIDLKRLSAQDSQIDQYWRVGVSQVNDQLEGYVKAQQHQLEGQQHQLEGQQHQLEGQQHQHHQVQLQLEDMTETYNGYIEQLQAQTNSNKDNVKSLQKQNDGLGEHVNALQYQSDQTTHRLNETVHQLELTQLSLQSLDEQFQKSDQRNFRDISYLKNDFTQQKRLMTLVRDGKGSRDNEGSEPKEQSLDRSSRDSHELDAFYVAFEEKFRGSEALVCERLKVYLPFLETTNLGTVEQPILDVGCGRGEWLNLLREHQYTAAGIDLNRVMVEECAGKGLEVKEADVVSYLKALPEGSLGCVTGFHIIEHLPFPVLMELFQETYRVLCSGGIIIFETPNPANIEVSSWSFYFDPTHRNPLPSPLSEFLAEFTGFERVETLDLHPDPHQRRLTGSDLADRFSDYFYGPQDYAVIGYKP